MICYLVSVITTVTSKNPDHNVLYDLYGSTEGFLYIPQEVNL